MISFLLASRRRGCVYRLNDCIYTLQAYPSILYAVSSPSLQSKFRLPKCASRVESLEFRTDVVTAMLREPGAADSFLSRKNRRARKGSCRAVTSDADFRPPQNVGWAHARHLHLRAQ